MTLIAENFVPEGIPIDGDNPDHIKWLYDRSVERANQFGITGVTVRLTQGKVCLKPYHFIPHNTIVFFISENSVSYEDVSLLVANRCGFLKRLNFVLGVIKRIIPAVASTNAVIAAACATEVFKIAT